MTYGLWLKELRDSNLPTELPEVVLTRPCDGRQLKGPASVVREASGALALKLYAAGDIRDVLGLVRSAPGALVAKDQLYDLHASDMSGQEWRAEGVWPTQSLSLPTGVAVTRADVHRLTATRQRRNHDASGLVVAFDCDGEIPANRLEHAVRRIGETVVSESTRRNAAELTIDGVRFRLYRDGDQLLVDLRGQWPSEGAAELADSVTSALQFLLGRHLRPAFEHHAAGTDEWQVIRSVNRRRLSSRTDPPFEWRPSGDDAAAWELFESFFRFMRVGLTPQSRELRRWTSEVIEAGGAPIEVEALVLCVAVEGVARMLQPAKTPDDALGKGLDQAIELIDNSTLPQEIKKRVKGSVNAMRKSRSRDCLEGLVSQGIVRSSDLDSWKGLRHSTAHAEPLEADFIESTFGKMSVVLALFYRLVFLLIGYRGAFTDYGQPGWPLVRSRPQSREGD